jgi:hypothetical protein
VYIDLIHKLCQAHFFQLSLGNLWTFCVLYKHNICEIRFIFPFLFDRGLLKIFCLLKIPFGLVDLLYACTHKRLISPALYPNRECISYLIFWFSYCVGTLPAMTLVISFYSFFQVCHRFGFILESVCHYHNKIFEMTNFIKERRLEISQFWRLKVQNHVASADGSRWWHILADGAAATGGHA